MPINTLPEAKIIVTLDKFGKRSYESTINLTIDGQPFSLKLQKKKTLKNFIGLPGSSYDLVIPKDLHKNEIIQKAFKGQKVLPVKVTKKNDRVTLTLPNNIGRLVFQ